MYSWIHFYNEHNICNGTGLTVRGGPECWFRVIDGNGIQDVAGAAINNKS